MAPNQGDVAKDTTEFLAAANEYESSDIVHIGEGGANYRSLLYRSYLEGSNKRFERTGSSLQRQIYEAPDMTTLPNSQLLLLDDETTQYISARLTWDEQASIPREVVYGDFKLRVVADAISHWYSQRERGLAWQPRRDISLARQAASFIKVLQTGEIDSNYYPEQAEDYCFARAFGLMSAAQALQKWPKLQHHESNRIESMERAIKQVEAGEIIDVNDHRVVQAIAMRYGLGPSRFKYPACVEKSWPRFWEFVTQARDAFGHYNWSPA